MKTIKHWVIAIFAAVSACLFAGCDVSADTYTDAYLLSNLEIDEDASAISFDEGALFFSANLYTHWQALQYTEMTTNFIENAAARQMIFEQRLQKGRQIDIRSYSDTYLSGESPDYIENKYIANGICYNYNSRQNTHYSYPDVHGEVVPYNDRLPPYDWLGYRLYTGYYETASFTKKLLIKNERIVESIYTFTHVIERIAPESSWNQYNTVAGFPSVLRITYKLYLNSDGKAKAMTCLCNTYQFEKKVQERIQIHKPLSAPLSAPSWFIGSQNYIPLS